MRVVMSRRAKCSGRRQCKQWCTQYQLFRAWLLLPDGHMWQRVVHAVPCHTDGA
jgi:hypothetical protein